MNKNRGICCCFKGKREEQRKAHKAGPCRGADGEEKPPGTKPLWVQKPEMWIQLTSEEQTSGFRSTLR